ncbi:MAG: flagellar basal body-associated protein FliL [Shewanella sp.]|uniref:flagellar basal body-associated protein FliL n=1 Tax=Shewanella sp. SNU WT4 TaxID=2590015 RepID=UPI00112E9014|nr:flagellar basal body-associated protein FliL [Shewanella sp. SNU WT4]QDF67681.1 flagellar basal body-associated protein FliL [Shewanella sp. SNU WT4]
MAAGLELENKDQPKAKSKLPLIIIAAVVVLLAIGGGAFFFLSGGEEPAPETTEAGAAAPATDPAAGAPATGEAFYVPMPRPFLFNLAVGSRTRLVEIKVQLMGRGTEDAALISKHIPLIEDALLSSFSAAEASNLSTQAGKDELRTDALNKVQTTVQTVTGRKLVEQVLFTGFVMQ